MAETPDRERDNLLAAQEEQERQCKEFFEQLDVEEWGHEPLSEKEKVFCSGYFRDRHDLRAGIITIEQFSERQASREELLEECLRELSDANPNPLMEYRARAEARMEGLTLLASMLASDAFKHAGMGPSSQEWKDRIFSFESKHLELRRATVAELEQYGPWPWPREDV